VRNSSARHGAANIKGDIMSLSASIKLRQSWAPLNSGLILT
jgi:hypothetical protein